ncbi:MAG: hypothetical protein AAB360_01830 [Patescibacteria group bacterium]
MVIRTYLHRIIRTGFLLSAGLVVAAAAGQFARGEEMPTKRPIEQPLMKKFTKKAKRNRIIVQTNKEVYAPGESVVFTIINKSKQTVFLRNSAPWQVVNFRAAAVFTPIAVQAIVPLYPGQEKSWVWQQNGNQAKPILPENYQIVFPRLGAASPPFSITSALRPPFVPLPLDPPFKMPQIFPG